MTEPFALTNATLVTGDTEGTVLAEMTVVVDRNGGIQHAGPSTTTQVPAGYRRVDVAGKFVAPGLINAHAHLFADGKPLPKFLLNESAQAVVAAVGHSPLGRRLFTRRTKANAVTQLHSGVTTIRSVADVRYEAVAVAQEIDRGDYLGPRLLASGPLLAIPGGHGAPQIALTADTPEEHRRHTRINLDRRVRAIKVCATGGVTDARDIGKAGTPEMTEADMRAVCEEAHQVGIRVAAHAQSVDGVLAALRAGVDTIEHGARMTPEIIDLFHHNPHSLTGTSALIPTVQVCLPLVKLDRSATGIYEIVQANAAMVLEEMLQGIRDAQEHGVRLGMGTDSALTYSTHYNAWRELDLLVRYGGLTPAQAFNAATQTNATILGLERVTGAVEPGKTADLVVLDANPLDNFATFINPAMVIARGHVLDQPSVKRFPEIDTELDRL